VTKAEEQIIIHNVVAGDAHQFALLVNMYKDMAVVLAFNILLNQQDAEEAAQDAFVKAYTALSSFTYSARFSTWLYRIVVNTALNKKKTQKPYPAQINDTLRNSQPCNFDESFATHITKEHRKHIQAALQCLNTNERLCITLYYLNELSAEEIRELTGITTANIKVLLHRGRKSLYAALRRQLQHEITNFI
jgi:RNA polymerase sigma-70 factor (ECF subfamily)